MQQLRRSISTLQKVDVKAPYLVNFVANKIKQADVKLVFDVAETVWDPPTE